MTKIYKNNAQVQKGDYTYLFDANQQGWIVFPTDSTKPTYGAISMEYDGYPVISIEEKRTLKEGEEICVGNDTYVFNSLLKGWQLVTVDVEKFVDTTVLPKYLGYPVISVKEKPRFENGEFKIIGDYSYTFDTAELGWHVRALGKTKTTYGVVEDAVGGYPVLSMGSCEWGGYYCSATFSMCQNLEFLPDEFTIPSSVTNIAGLFYDCISLKKIPPQLRIPAGVKSASGVFHYCENITEIPANFIIPEGVVNVDCFFSGCEKLKTIPKEFRLPESVLSAEEFFYDCFALEEIPSNFTIPQNCENVVGFFRNCFELNAPKSVLLPEKVQEADMFFSGCRKLTVLSDNFTIPEGAETVGYFFECCSSLTRLPEGFKIPEGVKILDHFFESCESLEQLPEGLTVPTTAQCAAEFLSYCIKLKKIPKGFSIPEKALEKGMLWGCTSLESIPPQFMDKQWLFEESEEF